jgi:hypothetical protein
MLFSIHFYWVEFHLNVFKSNAKVKRNFQLFADCTSKQNYSSMKTICKTDPLLLCFHLRKVFFVDGISSFIKFIWQVKLFQWRLLQIYWMNKLNKAFYSCLQKNCFFLIPSNVGHSIMISLFFPPERWILLRLEWHDRRKVCTNWKVKQMAMCVPTPMLGTSQKLK